MNEYLIAIIIAVVLIVFIVSTLIGIYNKLIMLDKNTQKSFANIDILLKQRADEIPNLVSIVKQSMNYEQETLEKLTTLRTKFLNANSNDEKIMTSNDMTSLLKTVFAISENYPDLKANDSLRDLQQRVSQLEDQISDRREYYNESVNMYNIGILEFPNLLFSKPLGYKQKTMLEITDKEKSYNGIQF